MWRRYALQPTGVSAKDITVSLMISSGSEVIRAERMNHCLPATSQSANVSKRRKYRCTLPTQDLRDAVLLMQEAFLVHLVQEAALAVPGREREEVFLSLLLRADVAHLHYDERVLPLGPGGEEYVCVQLARGALDTVAEVFDERGGGGAVEAAEAQVNLGSHRDQVNSLEEVPREDDGDWEGFGLVTRCYTECRASTSQRPPEILSRISAMQIEYGDVSVPGCSSSLTMTMRPSARTIST